MIVEKHILFNYVEEQSIMLLIDYLKLKKSLLLSLVVSNSKEKIRISLFF